MTEPGLLIVISGPSGAGKGTIRKSLLQCRPDIFFSVSATTRPPRVGEIDGADYYFMAREAFTERLERDEFLEWAEVYDNYYGTPRWPVEDALAAGQDVLLEVDVQGALKVKEKAPQGIYIFIVPPSLKELQARIIGRGTDSMEVINRRMGKTLSELAHYQQYDYVVCNQVLEDAVMRVECIITAEKCRSSRFGLSGGAGSDKPLMIPKKVTVK